MTESLKKVMLDCYEARLLNQANGMKDSPLLQMCLTSFRHGIENTLDEVEPKLQKLKKLADAMYTAAQNLSSGTWPLRKAMEEYHQFIINEF